MELLPDDVLAHIFSFLEPADLLGPVRAVCSSWQGLAVHWDAWSKRNFPVQWEGLRLAREVLRVAPRINSLDLYGYNQLDPEMEGVLATTTCGVRKLCINTYVVPDPERFLRSQLPHTRHLMLMLRGQECDAQVLELIQDMALVSLDLHFQQNMEPFMFLRPFRGRTLRRLTVRFCSDQDLLLESLVRVNAESLEKFTLEDHDGNIPYTLNALSALNCPRITVDVPASVLVDLIGVKNLGHLNVRVTSEVNPNDLEGLRVLSHGLLHPSSLTIDVRGICYLRSVAEFVCNWLQELGTCRRRWPLEHFEILGEPKCAAKNFSERLVNIPPVLKGLPHLRELRLPSVPPGGALDAMVLPSSLQLLDLAGSRCSVLRSAGGPRCCVPALRRLIARTPGLHVTGVVLHRCVGKCSRLGCHCLKAHGGPLRTWRERGPCGLRGQCPLGCEGCARYGPVVQGRWVGPL